MKYLFSLSPVLVNYCGFNPSLGRIITIKREHYIVREDISVSGDAPKNIVQVYEYGITRKSRRMRWPIFIAKIGHKHYPVESITEYLMNRIGMELGFYINKCKLCIIGGQIRFLSKYFLQKEETLIHGADLYAEYLNGDKQFVDKVEKEGLSKEFFTVQFTIKTFKNFIHEPTMLEQIIHSFFRMILFDAIVGNNDRHFYNWGIIEHKNKKYSFAPIYDTARGLFWNHDEHVIQQKSKEKNKINEFIKRYCENSQTKIGYESTSNLNHFSFLECIILMLNEIASNKSEFSKIFFVTIRSLVNKKLTAESAEKQKPQRAAETADVLCSA